MTEEPFTSWRCIAKDIFIFPFKVLDLLGGFQSCFHKEDDGPMRFVKMFLKILREEQGSLLWRRGQEALAGFALDRELRAGPEKTIIWQPFHKEPALNVYKDINKDFFADNAPQPTDDRLGNELFRTRIVLSAGS